MNVIGAPIGRKPVFGVWDQFRHKPGKVTHNAKQMSLVVRKPTFWFPTWSDTSWAVQPQKIARGLKFRIKVEEGLYYPCSENKGADQLICVFVFAYAKRWFSHDAAQIYHKHEPN